MSDREIDGLVAEKVCGWEHVDRCPNGAPCDLWVKGDVTLFDPPPYTADTPEGWAAMRDVVEAVKDRLGLDAWPFEIHDDRYSGTYSGGRWNVGVGCSIEAAGGDDASAEEFWNDPRGLLRGAASSDSLPRAVALAALSALGVEVER
jgi:hypothetical protein